MVRVEADVSIDGADCAAASAGAASGSARQVRERGRQPLFAAGALRDRSHGLVDVAHTVGGFRPRDLDPRADVACDFERRASRRFPDDWTASARGLANGRGLDLDRELRALRTSQRWSQTNDDGDE